ncbi:Crp/Fnr family transcriptional regulator [Oricola cellulosilytica]|uniref:Cyclic nucleotide-binding domain-containing protein n=1 Tax=Oricola cellulosilytica TaxID=1429082 RepID=A0A4R0PGA3_9HYPH|nr:cyclic nucleotide-binding domain-containing protein [Oricola cellulosilytica]TCD15894.1 cyclic nucleotide-binding domain-containing protein [Oricola cellulosilytica]
MSLEDDIRIISGVSLFESLSAEQLRLLAFGAERVSVAKGRDLYREGQSAEGGYVVASGAINLFRETERGRVVLSTIGPGLILGELALVTETRRLTGAVASEDSQVIRINRSLFRRMLEEYPETAAVLHGQLAERLNEMLRHIGALETRFRDD